MRDGDLNAIAADLAAALDQTRQIARVSERFASFDQAAAYAVADRVHRARLAQGWQLAGRKIGFTNRDLWAAFGVHAPIWGPMYDATVIRLPRENASLSLATFSEPRIEPEIVFFFRTAPPVNADAAELLHCIDWMAHGFEIVQTPYAGWKFSAADAIAAAALHGVLLLGAPQPLSAFAAAELQAQLERFTVELECNGVVRDRGGGAKVLGSPLAATLHLIEVLRQQPGAAPIAAGELVTTGSLTMALPVAAGETWTTHVQGLQLPGLSVNFVA